MTRTLLLVLALEVALAGWWALPSVHADDEEPAGGVAAGAAKAGGTFEVPPPAEVSDEEVSKALAVLRAALDERRPGLHLYTSLDQAQVLQLAQVMDPGAVVSSGDPRDVELHFGQQIVLLRADPRGSLRIRHSMKGEGISPELANAWNYDMRFATCSVDPDGNFHFQRDVLLIGGVSPENLLEELRLFRSQFIEYAKRIAEATK